MKRKLFTSLIVLAAMMLALFGFAGCNNDAGGENEVKVTLSETQLTLKVGETHTLIPTVSGSEETPAYESSAPAVATVDANGLVTAVEVGKATVTVTVGTAKAACEVTVTENDLVPVISLNYEEVELVVGRDLTVQATMTYDAAAVTGSFIWSEDSNGEVIRLEGSGDRATVSALKAGTAEVTVKSEYRGKEAETSMLVTVKEDVSIEIENLELKDGQYKLALSTNPQDGEIKEFAPEVSVLVGGKKVADAEVSLSVKSGEGVVTVGGGKIVAQKRGEAVVELVYTKDGDTYKQEIAVTVTAPAVRGEHLDFEGAEEQEVTIEGIGTVTAVTIDTDILTFEQEGETLTLSGFEYVTLGEHVLSVEADNMLYTAEVTVVTKIVNTAEEWNEIIGSVSSSKDGVSGYYILGSDLDYTGKSLPAFPDIWNQEGIKGFGGTFDGRGHIVKGLNLTAEMQGMFWRVEPSGIVRNVGFVDVTLNAGRTGVVASLFYGTAENLFATFNKISNYSGGFFTYLQSGGSMKYCAAIQTNASSVGSAYKDYGIVLSSYNNTTIENCYSLAKDGTHGDDGDKFSHTAEPTETVKNFADFAAAKAAQLDLSGWDTDIWNVESGFPVFKGYHDALDPAKAIGKDNAQPVKGAFDLEGSREYAYSLKEETEGITLEGTTVTIVGNAGATFTVVATHGLFGDVTTEKKFTVASLPTSEMGNLDVDLSTGGFTVEIEGTATKVYVNGSEATFTQSSKLVTVTGVTGEVGQEVSITIETTEANLTYSGYFATKVIKTPEEWNAVVANIATTPVEGYYVLGADLDYADKELPAIRQATWGGTEGFAGTFDGRGHVIKNVSLQPVATAEENCAFFGLTTTTAVIRNVAFLNATIPTGCFRAGVVATFNYGLIENVYVQVNSIGTSAGGICFALYGTISHCVVEETNTRAGTVALCARGYGGSKVENSFSVGAKTLYNTNGDSPEAGPETDALKGFETSEAFAAAKPDLSGWDTEIWDTSSGVPVFKGIKQD